MGTRTGEFGTEMTYPGKPQGTSMSESQFQKFRFVLQNRMGLQLSDRKLNLVEGRLQKILVTWNLKDFSQLIQVLEQNPKSPLFIEIVNQLTTNHTFFYRESRHFDYLEQELVPRWIWEIKQGLRDKIRIWSAACSSGEEPYTIAMILSKTQEIQSKYRILATDLAITPLEIANRGIYSSKALSKLPADLARVGVRPLPDGGEITPAIKEKVVFRKLNLTRDSYPLVTHFDMIFCRNVLIYFSQEVQSQVTRQLLDQLDRGGTLILSHTESLDRSIQGVNYVQPGVYQKHSRIQEIER
jgi:chemotaxis protein methyltransferase CheR